MVEKSQLVSEVKDTLHEFVALVNSRFPLKCRFCHEPINLEDGGVVTDNGVYHGWCHERAFPSEYGLRGDLSG